MRDFVWCAWYKRFSGGGVSVEGDELAERLRVYNKQKSVSDRSLSCEILTENSWNEESIAVDRFDRWRAQNIVPRAINGTRSNDSPSLD
ncbi:hypothetical protein TNCV_267381 [Trichonephila clavipes]|nr:hypothetical protein TNCV_267381 [Trichonephila clavipes]